MTLTEFLLARIAEDEAVARRAAFGWGEGWTSEMNGEWGTVHADGKRNMVGCEDGDVTRHIAIHDPARVLAECEVKQMVMEMIDDGQIDDDYLRIQRALALPYADHPDYLPEWEV